MTDNEQKPMPTPMSDKEIVAVEVDCRTTHAIERAWAREGVSAFQDMTYRADEPIPDCTLYATAIPVLTVERLIATIRHLQASLAEVRAERDSLLVALKPFAFAYYDTTKLTVGDYRMAHDTYALTQPPSPEQQAGAHGQEQP